MKFATIDRAGRPAAALVADDGSFLDLQQALAALPQQQRAGFDGSAGGPPLTVVGLIAAGERARELVRNIQQNLDVLATAWVDPRTVRLLAPIPRTPRNVFCVGRNYVDHIQEDNVSRDKQTPPPEYPQFFTKPASSIVGDGEAIRYDDRVTRRLDYEVELAVVIGKGGRDIPASRAMEHVFGYTIVNDVTARDLQRRHDQWFKGKGLDTFCPTGPWIVTADDIPDPHTLRIALSVNGEPRQSASTGDMIFRIPQLIESLSAGLTLEAGDVIATGTPSGVGYAMNPRRFLAAGDVVACTLERIGTLTNAVEAAH